MAEEHTYMAGDTIMVRLHLQHNANIRSVEAEFVPAVGTGGRVEFYEPRTNPEVHLAKHDQLTTEFVIELIADITGEHEPGEYYCRRLWAELGSGKEIEFDRKPDDRFRVLREPVGYPQLGSWEVVDPEPPGPTMMFLE